MDSYSGFAYVYDTFMDETPYEEWKEYIVDILKDNGIDDGLVLDLGCGTGTLTRLLSDSGYDMIGVDNSEDMLCVAREYEMDEDGSLEGSNILYLCQDMRQFELYGTVRAVISVCDCINYLLEDEDIVSTFKLVNNYLDKEGLFIFDFNTTHKYRDVIGDTVIAENREECSFIWDNYYDKETKINDYVITIFSKVEADDGEDDNLYEKFQEEHLQKGYDLDDMKRMLDQAGMEFVRAFDTDTGKEVTMDSERITVIAKEKFMEGKLYINE